MAKAKKPARAADTSSGLTIDRVFSTEGESPFDSVSWTTRDAAIKNFAGQAIFEQRGVEFPDAFSPLAVNVVASKYFYGDVESGNGSPENGKREHSLRQLVHRVTRTIADWGRSQHYFASDADAETFYDELTWLCTNQVGAFNSPVWFNVGLGQQYGIRDSGGKTISGWDPASQQIQDVDPYQRPQASACFIISVQDSVDDIWKLMGESARLFKFGSGVGADWSKLRSSHEKLSGGGTPSGPVSFMKVQDATGGTIKSGGKCLAPETKVYTERGPVAVEALAALTEREGGRPFHVLSYDPPSGRMKVKRAQAWQSGTKEVVRVHTDKGHFDLSFDHPVKLASGPFALAGDLQPGQRLFQSTLDPHNAGYVRVSLRDGKEGRELLHRMVAADAMGHDLDGLSVHHRDGDKLNNHPDNLEVISQAEHASLRGAALAEAGEHVFQHADGDPRFDRAGESNGMHRSGRFWRDPARTQAYRESKRAEMEDRDPARLQTAAVRQRYMNVGWQLLNAGHDISTEDRFLAAYQTEIGRIDSKPRRRAAFESQFGGYDGFLAELDASNHRVTEVEWLGEMAVYSVEVDCPTADDKTEASGHNFLIWSGDNDAPFGSGVVVSNTRRAAIMQTLKVWHPDVEEFVRAKQQEEKKAWALIEQGYDGSFNGPAYGSVDFQNVNQSVRLDDAFMEAADQGISYDLRAVTSGEPVETIDAAALLDLIAQGTHICGDPGAQYEDTIQKWHTCKTTDAIHSSNPCSEYMFLDDSACNLASINLRKFKAEDGGFDVERYRAAARIFITAQEILVDNAGYPSAKVALNSHKFRPLGLGFANLGALLMSMGLPYDSDEGRAVAGALMAIEHCEAYARSAEIAANKQIGPFAGYAENAEPMLEVMRMHRDAVQRIDASCPQYLRQAAQESADRMVALGEAHGYRNAQATVLAPTGTIGFMMDCDTTGIEPDLALVKYKLLAGKGDGLMKIVNQTVPEALAQLGYSDAEAQVILDYVDQHDTIEGAPGLREEHLPVFDCAFKPSNGERYISHMGHIGMMAACQPFISGAISKTVNLPESATVADIADAYLQSWKAGLKAVAIYRENSKRSQPLSTTKGGNTAAKTEDAAKDFSGDGAPGSASGAGSGTPELVETIVEKIVYRPHRERLPDERPSVTHKFSVAGHEGYLHVGLYPEGHKNAGRPGEIFITMAKQGSTIAGLMDSFATAISLAFQYGVPLEDLVSKFGHVRFEPAGFTNNPQIPIAKSITDYIFRYLNIKFLGGGDGGAPDLADGVDADEVSVDPTRAVAAQSERHGPAHDQTQSDLFATAQKAVDAGQPQHVGGSVDAVLQADADGQLGAFQNQDDAPACPNCGGITVRAGSCYSCPNCGSSTGCG